MTKPALLHPATLGAKRHAVEKEQTVRLVRRALDDEERPATRSDQLLNPVLVLRAKCLASAFRNDASTQGRVAARSFTKSPSAASNVFCPYSTSSRDSATLDSSPSAAISSNIWSAMRLVCSGASPAAKLSASKMSLVSWWRALRACGLKHSPWRRAAGLKMPS